MTRRSPADHTNPRELLSGECFTDLIERALNGAELPHYARVAY
jgi:hypothetical protein